MEIFGEDLFDKQSLLDIFIELTGNGEYKPFDCVGTYEEVNYAITFVISKLKNNKQKLPYLLEYFEKNYKLADMSEDITKRYNENNNLTEEQNVILMFLNLEIKFHLKCNFLCSFLIIIQLA